MRYYNLFFLPYDAIQRCADVSHFLSLSLLQLRRFFLHYNFPSYSTGTVGGGGGVQRHAKNHREIGHGKLAERALEPSLPSAHDFPYAIRVTSEVTRQSSIDGDTQHQRKRRCFL